MQVRIFAIPMDGDADALEELNVFLRSQKVLSVERVAAVDQGRHYWSLCVEYLPRRAGETAPGRNGALTDGSKLKHAGVLDRTAAGVAFLGLLVRPSHVRLMGRTKRRVRRRLQRLVAAHRTGIVGATELSLRATALLARTRQVRARGLRRRWIAEFAGVDA